MKNYNPITVEEKIQYAQLQRLDALVDMLSSLIAHIAEKEGVAVQDKTIEPVKTPKPRKPRKKTVKKEVKKDDSGETHSKSKA